MQAFRRASILSLTSCTLALAGCAAGSQLPLHGSPYVTYARSGPTSSPRLLLDAEFSGRSLDRKIWTTCYPWVRGDAGCTNTPPDMEWYRPENVSVGGGNANLTAMLDSEHPSRPYSSGMISTGGTLHRKVTFAYLYGYAETRIKFPPGKGMWPAFWMVPADRTWPPEIDAMEWQGVTPKLDFCTIHWGTAQHPQQDQTVMHTGVNLADAFHVYAVDWEANAVTWYFDGTPVKTYTDRRHIPNKPMYVIVNLAVGGWERGQNRPPARNFPATMKVDYVRVWSRKPE